MLVQLDELAAKLSQLIKRTTLYMPEQDGPFERSIRTIIERARCATINQDIPYFLWDKVAKAMVHVTNRVATRVLNSKTPYQCFIDDVSGEKQEHIPLVSHIRVIGYKTYVLIEKEKRITSEKLAPRAKVSILVGFKRHYIYRVYIPSKRRVIRTSHCRFDEGQGLITESNGTDLSLPDRPNSRGNSNQDFKDTGISPSQETVSFDTHDRVSHNKIDPDSLFNL
jgi:hypothetical protein